MSFFPQRYDWASDPALRTIEARSSTCTRLNDLKSREDSLYERHGNTLRNAPNSPAAAQALAEIEAVQTAIAELLATIEYPQN